MSVEAQIARGSIERVASDLDAARAELEQARKHLESASVLLETDAVMAHSAAYEAARKAVSAHMRARGYRVKGQVGHHAKLFEYAAVALSSQVAAADLEQLDDMRAVRNDAAYRARTVGRGEVEADLEIARLVVAAVTADI